MSTKPRSNAAYLENDGMDPVSEALDRLDTKFYSVENGIIKPLNKRHTMTVDEWKAIVYLIDEWTFLYEPESDLLEAALLYTRTHDDVEEEEVYIWEG